MTKEPTRGEAAILSASFISGGRSVIPVDDRIAQCFPAQGIKRGSITLLKGSEGSGLYSLTALMIARATQEGEWVALVNLSDLGYGSFFDVGVEVSRVVVIKDLPTAAQTTHTLLESFALVVTAAGFNQTQALRLSSRVRERGAAMVVVERSWRYQRRSSGSWGGRIDMTITLENAGWRLASPESELLLRREPLSMTVTHKGMNRTLLAAVS